MILSAILLFIAGCFWAVIDTLLHHYDISIFRDTDRRWSDPTVSWKNKYETFGNGEIKRDENGKYRRKMLGHSKIPVPVMLTDAWHFFKAWVLFCFFAAIVGYHPEHTDILHRLLHLVIFVLCYGAGFGLFYNFILIDPQYRGKK